MKTLVKVGAALALLSILMTSGFYTYLKAEGERVPAPTLADRTVTTENRPLAANVNQIEISGPMDVNLKQGATPGIRLQGEQRLLKRIKTDTSGNALMINFEGGFFRSHHPLTLEITVPSLEKLTVRGSGDIDSSGFKGEQMQLTLTGSGNLNFDGQYQKMAASLRGSGDVELASGNGSSVELDLIGSGNLNVHGQTKTLVTRLNGSGDLDAAGLKADTVTVNLNGSGNTNVHAVQSLTVNLRGSGDIRVKGNPPQRNISKNGSGDVDFE